MSGKNPQPQKTEQDLNGQGHPAKTDRLDVQTLKMEMPVAE